MIQNVYLLWFPTPSRLLMPFHQNMMGKLLAENGVTRKQQINCQWQLQ